MARTELTPHVEARSDRIQYDPMLRNELRRAAVWLGLALALAGLSSSPALAFDCWRAGLFGRPRQRNRLLGRFLRRSPGMAADAVVLAGFGFIGWVFYFAGDACRAGEERSRGN